MVFPIFVFSLYYTLGFHAPVHIVKDKSLWQLVFHTHPACNSNTPAFLECIRNGYDIRHTAAMIEYLKHGQPGTANDPNKLPFSQRVTPVYLYASNENPAESLQFIVLALGYKRDVHTAFMKKPLHALTITVISHDVNIGLLGIIEVEFYLSKSIDNIILISGIVLDNTIMIHQFSSNFHKMVSTYFKQETQVHDALYFNNSIPY